MTPLRTMVSAAVPLGLVLLSPAGLALDVSSDPRSVLEHFAASDAGFYGADYINRFHLDINGDSLEEVFLSLDSSGGSAGSNWAVYLRRPDGRYRFFDHIGLHKYGFRLSTEPPGLDVYWRYAATTGSFMFYSVTDDGFEPTEGTGEIATDTKEALRRFDAIGRWHDRVDLVHYSSPIASLRRGTEIWRQETRPPGYTKDPDLPIEALGNMLLEGPGPSNDPG